MGGARQRRRAASAAAIGLAAAAAGGACVEPPLGATSRALVGGEASEPGEFDATGMLVGGRSMRCTATLIAPDVVLTAAHCLAVDGFGGLGFSLDRDARDGIDDIVPALIAHAHPEFDDRVEEFLDLGARHDIGVVILERPLEGVAFERLGPALDDDVLPGAELALCGYGRELWYGGAGLKRHAHVTVDRLGAHELGTSPVGPQPCRGDSGGPLIADRPSGRHVVGVVSRAMGASTMCDTGAIVTRVAPYLAWIEHASQQRAAGCAAAGGAGLLGPLAALAGLALRRRRAA